MVTLSYLSACMVLNDGDLKFWPTLDNFPEIIRSTYFPVAMRSNILLLITVRGPNEIAIYLTCLYVAWWGRKNIVVEIKRAEFYLHRREVMPRGTCGLFPQWRVAVKSRLLGSDCWGSNLPPISCVIYIISLSFWLLINNNNNLFKGTEIEWFCTFETI